MKSFFGPNFGNTVIYYVHTFVGEPENVEDY